TDTIARNYSTLAPAADASYSHALHDALPIFNNLETGQTLTDTFNYTASDAATIANTSASTLTITIDGHGAPVAHPDTNTVVEDTAQNNATEHLLRNDTDIDPTSNAPDPVSAH